MKPFLTAAPRRKCTKTEPKSWIYGAWRKILFTFSKLNCCNTLLMIITLIMLCGCNNKDITGVLPDTAESTICSDSNIISKEYPIFEEGNYIDNVATELINAENTSAKVKIYNNLNREIDVEGNFEIQIKTDNGWSNLPYVTDFEGFIGHANPIASHSSLEFEIKWGEIYGNLSAGHYRIVNSFLSANENGNYSFSEKNYLYSEFDIY